MGGTSVERPNRLDDCTWGTISSEQLACWGRGTELVRRSKVLQLGIRTLIELALHTFIPRNFAVNRRFKSCCEDYSTLCTLFMLTKYTIASY